MQKTHWGFDVKNLDRGVRPQDDFYRFANGRWLKQHPIPRDESRWGSFIILRYKTERQLKALLKRSLKKQAANSFPQQQIADFYRSAMDMRRRNALGIRPILKERNAIRAIASVEDLLTYAARSHQEGGSAFFTCFVDQDLSDSTRYLLEFRQGGLGLPEREYYLKNAPEQWRVRSAYVHYVEKLLRLSGMNAEESARARKAVMKIETLLARSSMSKEDMRDVDKMYHKMSVARLSQKIPGIAWKNYLEVFGARAARDVNLAQPHFFADLARLLKTVPLREWKLYLEWHLVSDTALLLSEPFVRTSFDFWGRTVTGSKKMKSLWRRSLGALNAVLGEPLGKLYVERYFRAPAKRAMDELVDDLFAAYRERILRLDWMSGVTKRKALQKLGAMDRKIGHPSRWRSYRALGIRPDDYFGNFQRAIAFEHRRVLRRLLKPVDRKEWCTVPQVVNAFYHPNLNDITFPAAILQFPFFALSSDAAVNYGAIGSVIGDELTHGFDDQGAKFDGKGNRKNWWVPRDQKKFIRKSQTLAKQFDRYKAAGIRVNGTMTLGENIADLGGLAIAFDAYERHLAQKGRKTIGGFTPEERFFFGFAQQEQMNARREFVKMAALTDSHSPASFRVNGPLSNFERFYETFAVKKGDGLYREPHRRAKIW